MSDDYIHVDESVNAVLDNWWLEADDILYYIQDRGSRDIKFSMKIKELLSSIDWVTFINKAVIETL